MHVDFPTRGRGSDSPHILDLVITNKDIVETVAPLGKSDHSVLLIGINVHSKPIDAIPKLNLNKGNYNKLREYLDLDWDSELKQCTGDVEMMWSVIKHRLLAGVYKYVPTTLPFASWKKDKWKRPLDKELRSMIRQKSILWRRYVRSKDNSVYVQYKKLETKSETKLD